MDPSEIARLRAIDGNAGGNAARANGLICFPAVDPDVAPGLRAPACGAAGLPTGLRFLEQRAGK
jgi:hypothetical protein